MQQLESTQDRLVFTANFPNILPQAVYNHLIQPDLLAQWWPPEAEVTAKVGGSYWMSWPAMNWQLRGIYKAATPGKILIFTWHWDHEPDTAPTEVCIVFNETSTGTAITLTHGVYASTAAGQKERQEHQEGWMHFLAELQNLF